MDKLQKYKKIRLALEIVSTTIAVLLGSTISSSLGIYGKGLISVDTALSMGIIIIIAIVLEKISIKIADNWYKKNMDK